MEIKHIFSGKTHKENESDNDCQDYFDHQDRSYAIADGSSQSFYPSIWAKLLVEKFCKDPNINNQNWEEWLYPIQSRWLEEVKKRVAKIKVEEKPSWITNHNLLNSRTCATSTFLGLHFTETQVNISIVGDSCLFIFEKDKQPESYLLTTSSKFNDRPEYLASYSDSNMFSPHFFTIPLDNIEHEKYFILATDALAEMMLKFIAKEKDILSLILNISSQNEFETFVFNARTKHEMKNDDVTLVIVRASHNTSSHTHTKIIDEVKDCDEQQVNQIVSVIKPDIFQEELNQHENTNSSGFTSFLNFINNKFNAKKSVPKSENLIKILKKENQHLKIHRFILSILFVTSSIFALISHNNEISTLKKLKLVESVKKEEAPNKKQSSKSIDLSKGFTIYKDQALKQVIVKSLTNSSKALILEEKDNWIKFEMPLYAKKSQVKECTTCDNNNVELLLDTNIRISNKISQDTIFGKLDVESKFKKIECDKSQEWCKFKFEGYLKK